LMVVTSFSMLATAPVASEPGVESNPVSNGGGSGNVDMSALGDLGSKVDSVLVEQASATDGPIMTYVVVSDRESANEVLSSEGLPTIGGRTTSDQLTVRIMELSAGQITTLAKCPGVVKIMHFEKPAVEPARTELAGESWDIEGSLPSVEDYEIDEVHGAVDAWENGWTGEGVKLAVIDDGFDMAHPDMQGQQARYENPASPFFGWPIAYDDYGAYMWNEEKIGGWIADTSTEVTARKGASVSFDGARYKVRGIEDIQGNRVQSQSGIYHIGYHPDSNFATLWGGQVAILVVDTIEPGVYDTVYVDVTRDFNFGNDKPCTKGDEISYFDNYDPAYGSIDDSSWDSGDGYADYSGGMIYWISDGLNAYPGSDWTYGATFTGGAGDAVAVMGAFAGTHGTMTSSSALAVGRTMGGQLAGMAPGAKLICIPFTGSTVNAWMFAQYGADGLPGTGDEANIVSNSYGWSDTAVDAGFQVLDMIAMSVSLSGPTMWFWSSGNGGPGYGTSHSVVDVTSVHVGAGTTMMYRYWLGYELYPGLQKWGDVIPFSNSGPGRNGKLNSEIIASGAYSMEPAPLNVASELGTIGDGSNHFQIGSGTSHATPTTAGGAALGFQAYYLNHDSQWPEKDYAKALLMAAADDMHFDPFKQGSGWLNAGTFADLMAESAGTVSYSSGPSFDTSALYPGGVYGTSYDMFPNFLLPGESVDTEVTTKNSNPESAELKVTSELLLKTGGDSINLVTKNRYDIFVDITDLVPETTDLLRVTMYMPFEQFDPEMDYVSNVEYWLELHDWVDVNGNGQMGIKPTTWELFRYTVDGSDCNYNQAMIKDPIERTTDGLIVRVRAITGMKDIGVSLQLDYFELKEFAWARLMDPATSTEWGSSLGFALGPGETRTWNIRIAVPENAPIGTYGAGVYIDDGQRIQCMPITINVPATEYEFAFGGESYFETPYNNDVTGVTDKYWRFEVGDWRIYWCLPDPASEMPAENDYLLTAVEWSELPGDVNLHVLAPVSVDGLDPETAAIFSGDYGPGYYETAVASSDERYMGAGIFGSWTNTGGPKEVIAAPVGEYASALDAPAPFAIVTRCPLLAGYAPSETISGFTQWLTMNGYGADTTEMTIDLSEGGMLSGTVPGWFDIDFAGETIEVAGGGEVPMTVEHWPNEPISQGTLSADFDADLANAEYTRPIAVQTCSKLTVAVKEVADCPDIDLGLWYDANLDGIASLTEPYWYVGAGGSDETLTLRDPADGQYLIKVLGYTVVGDNALFDLTVMMAVAGAYMAADIPAGTFVPPGMYNFDVLYTVPAVEGVYRASATFGFLGANDMFRIELVISVVA